jgi:hypothetical protein
MSAREKWGARIALVILVVGYVLIASQVSIGVSSGGSGILWDEGDDVTVLLATADLLLILGVIAGIVAACIVIAGVLVYLIATAFGKDLGKS